MRWRAHGGLSQNTARRVWLHGVWCCVRYTTGKAQLVQFRMVKHVLEEKRLLAKMDHPFILSLLGCFQDASARQGSIRQSVHAFPLASILLLLEYSVSSLCVHVHGTPYTHTGG